MKENNKLFIVTFYKDFGSLIGDCEWIFYTTTDKSFAIKKAERLNSETWINKVTEHFRVWESKTKKFSQKNSKLIYDKI